jgi:hypothetical protein
MILFEFNDSVWPCQRDHNKNFYLWQCVESWTATKMFSDNSHSMEQGHNFDTRQKKKKNKTVQ